MRKEAVDFSLYLVTDSTPAILGDKDLVEVVEGALRGGVKVVQFRDKSSETRELVQIATRLHSATQSYKVPLIINDRVDVALAVGCEGCHIGQDDMELSTARRLLGPDAIIGVTVSTVEEALEACKGGADYLGIGTVMATPTKTNTKNIIGISGVRRILEAIADAGYRDIPTVCIGGINGLNVKAVLLQSRSPEKCLDGVAVVSAIMAAQEPAIAAIRLRNDISDTLETHGMLRLSVTEDRKQTRPSFLRPMVQLIKAVNDTTPLTHNMTNQVVQNFAANIALAIGASPIMSNNGDEAADLAKLGGALVINMGTVTPEGLENYVKAIQAYNEAGRPVLFDPVGAGATSIRRSAARRIMSSGYINVIKGNEGEIKALMECLDEMGGTTQQRGVDSTSVLEEVEKVELIRELAKRENNVVVMTGKVDYVTDGENTLAIRNGHEYLGMVTGTGCVLGTVISAMLAVCPDSDLTAAMAGMVLFEIAAELAAERPSVTGPGTFVPVFIDELVRLRRCSADGDMSWMTRAKMWLRLHDTTRSGYVALYASIPGLAGLAPPEWGEIGTDLAG